jgi:hypothetical protein
MINEPQLRPADGLVGAIARVQAEGDSTVGIVNVLGKGESECVRRTKHCYVRWCVCVCDVEVPCACVRRS